MFCEFFSAEKKTLFGEDVIEVTTSFPYSLSDTLECGQCFRHERVSADGEEYLKYIIPVGDKLITVGQNAPGVLVFYGVDDDTFEKVIVPYFDLNTDYTSIKRDILGRCDSLWLRSAADAAEGIAILHQDPWQTLVSFIISQNNNIPRIRKIIREICSAYGVNISLQNKAKTCPVNKINCAPCEEKCKNCGICYTFPTAEQILKEPEKLLPSHPGFRYRYLCDAAEKVVGGEVDLNAIKAAHSYDYTVSELKRIVGVGDKVAACCALFGFSNLEAFPVDVWMKRAIDTYFDGHLDIAALGSYAGIAQQYIFHYIRNIEGKQE